MARRDRLQTASSRWATRFAGEINDPVLRLRFLRKVVRLPGLDQRTRTRRRRFVRVLSAVLLAAVLTLAVLIRAAATSEMPRHTGETVARAPLVTPAGKRRSGAPVWQIEGAADSETYSNGLRIDCRYGVANHPRRYLAFSASQPEDRAGVLRTKPAGIVFHVTESRQAPFEPEETAALKRIGESLLDYVRQKRAYHFVIDRFGRVYRVVKESDAANHAGHSVWGDDQWFYINLNESFLGVAFEARTAPAQVEPEITSAQVRAASDLVEMLRGRYGISAGNCVTHAQVSVNPSNMRVGYHTDWSSTFPFEGLGLPNNYLRGVPAVSLFGFEFDPTFLHTADSRMHSAMDMADADLRARAGAHGLTPAAYRKRLQSEYRARLTAARAFQGGA